MILEENYKLFKQIIIYDIIHDGEKYKDLRTKKFKA